MREARAEEETIPMRNQETTNNAATGAEQCAHVASQKPASKKGARKRMGMPKAKKTIKPKKPAKAPAKKDASERRPK
jgi:hypothetical protein